VPRDGGSVKCRFSEEASAAQGRFAWPACGSRRHPVGGLFIGQPAARVRAESNLVISPKPRGHTRSVMRSLPVDLFSSLPGILRANAIRRAAPPHSSLRHQPPVCDERRALSELCGNGVFQVIARLQIRVEAYRVHQTPALCLSARDKSPLRL
jgi:hypothetical protein